MKLNLLLSGNSRVIPVFYAVDDGYVPFLSVSIRSLIDNSSKKYRYKIYILHTDITRSHQDAVKQMETSNCRIFFVDVSKEIEKIEKKICLRDYYSATTYFRMFIADLFPEYKKVLYIDGDTVIRSDIAGLYRYELNLNLVGGVRDQAITQIDVFSNYVEQVLGISRGSYFNAGVLLINCDLFRRQHIFKQFIELTDNYTFVVAQDQDYLNILCKDRVLWLDPRWNVQTSGNLPYSEDKAKIMHYTLAVKPWHDKECKMGSFFWEYAARTGFYSEIVNIHDSYTPEDRKNDSIMNEKLQELALMEIGNGSNYRNLFLGDVEFKLTRAEVLKRIERLEKAGVFDKDVEDDPPAKELKPGDIDYLRRSVKSRLRARYAFRLAHWFVGALIAKKQFVLKEIKGIDNLKNLNCGAVITCNHFNAFDSFAMQLTFEKTHKRKKLFRIISEANYTAFPGFYGFLMRNCNTLPLSSNKRTMFKLIMAIKTLLQKGHYILIYPEQSMWWNYRKPKPLKRGGFIFAVDNNVPVVPCFITMEDTEVCDPDGYPVQAYTVNVGTPIFCDKTKNRAENIDMIMHKNSEYWKNVYEDTYGIPLTYTCDEE